MSNMGYTNCHTLNIGYGGTGMHEHYNEDVAFDASRTCRERWRTGA
jgi:hypothetical protein